MCAFVPSVKKPVDSTTTSTPSSRHGSFPGSRSASTFTVRDAALTSAAATVSITVTPVNDPPQAVAQSVSVSVNTANPVTLAGLDAEGYALAYAVASFSDIIGDDQTIQVTLPVTGANKFYRLSVRLE